MLYFVGFLMYLVWLASLWWRWPVSMFELLMCWLAAAVGFQLMDSKWPAFDKQGVKVRSIWFWSICTIGASLALYNLLR